MPLAHAHTSSIKLTCEVTGEDKDVEEVTEMFADLAKKVRMSCHNSSTDGH